MFRVLFDVDGVMASLMEYILDYVYNTHPEYKRITIEEITSYKFESCISDPALKRACRSALSSPRIAQRLPLIDLRIPSFIQELKKDGVDVKYCTAPYFDNVTWVNDRLLWLMENVGAKTDDVVFTTAKYLVKGDVLVDDSPEQIYKFAQANANCDSVIVYDRPWNQSVGDEFPRAHNWDELMYMIRNRKLLK